MNDIFANLCTQIAQIPVIKRVGRVAELAGGTLRVTGLSQGTSLGDRVVIRGSGSEIGGEVLRLSREGLTILPDGMGEGLAINDMVEIAGRAEIAPDNSWIGRVIDPFGKPIDGRPLMQRSACASFAGTAAAACNAQSIGGKIGNWHIGF